MSKFLASLKENLVALISLVVALTALLYTTWREEETERNRTTRWAAFEVLKSLGELQININKGLYLEKGQQDQIFQGWGQISMISDLSVLLPEPIPEHVQKLVEAWRINWKNIPADDAASDKVTEQVDSTRQATLEAVKELK